MLSGGLQLSNQAVREVSVTQKHCLGIVGTTRDGRVFRYALGGAADLVKANALVAADPVANHQNCLVAVAAAIGDRKVKITIGATAATLDQYKDGWLTIQDGTGEGFTYLVAGNQASAGSENIWVYLQDPIEVALPITAEATLDYNLYANVVISATDQADCPAGIAHLSVDVSVAPYFWVQTGGHAAIWGDEAVAAGDALTTGTGTAGQLEMQDASGEPFWGHTIDTGVDGEHTLAFLMLN
jgi:hypothetical protein